jgi:hypothetical protein
MPEPLDLRKIKKEGPPSPKASEGITKPLEILPKRGLWQRLTGERMKRSEKIILIVFLIIFLGVFYIVLDANKYRAQVRVIEGEGRVGINPTTERLDFGDLSRGTSAVRRVDIQNEAPIGMFIIVVRVGSISDLMEVSKNYFTLKPGTSEKIEFTVYMPASAEIERLYTGRVFIFRIPFRAS